MDSIQAFLFDKYARHILDINVFGSLLICNSQWTPSEVSLGERGKLEL